MKIRRGDLFDAVWQTPRKQLAEQWRVSASTITSACRQFDVPVPRAGYWTRVSMGKPTQSPFLTGTRETSIELVEQVATRPTRTSSKNTANPTTKFDSHKTSLSTGKPEPPEVSIEPSAVSVKATIQEAAPAIRKAYRSYNSPAANRDDRYKHVLPGSDSIVRIAVMPEMVERALLLMDAILRAVAAEEWAVQIPSDQDRTKNSVEIDGVKVLFTLTEQRKQERVKSHKMWTDWEYRYHSTGILRFQYGVGRYLSEIKDNKNQPLEERIVDIIHALRDEVSRVQNVEIERREQERLHRLGQMLAGMVDRALKYNEQCEERLNHCAEKYEQAAKIRAFVKELKQRTHPDQWRPEQLKWLDWALRRADELDPICQFDHLDHSVPETVLSQVRAAIDSEPERYAQLQELDLERSVENKIDWRRRFPSYP